MQTAGADSVQDFTDVLETGPSGYLGLPASAKTGPIFIPLSESSEGDQSECK